MSPAEINAIGVMLAGLRDATEGVVAIGFAAHDGDHDTPEGSISATVTASGITCTSSAVSLADALLIARGKLRREIQAKKVAAEKAKLEAQA
jgi:hypothetical protein